MGRFDALTQLEEKPEHKAPLPAVLSSTPQLSQTKTIKKQPAGQKKPANLQARKPTNPSPTHASPEKPEKYTTRLEPSLVKKIRLHAIEKDIKDYEVVKTALNQYFERNI
jgi:hypothetical protein